MALCYGSGEACKEGDVRNVACRVGPWNSFFTLRDYYFSVYHLPKFLFSYFIFYYFHQDIRRALYSPVHVIPNTQLTLPTRRTLGRRHLLNRPSPHPHPPKRRRKNPNGYQNRYTVRLTPMSSLIPRLFSFLPPALPETERKKGRKEGREKEPIT
jgi:hypothetical protein